MTPTFPVQDDLSKVGLHRVDRITLCTSYANPGVAWPERGLPGWGLCGSRMSQTSLVCLLGVGSSSSSQWDFWGSTLVTSSYVRLTSDDRSKQGSIWNTVVRDMSSVFTAQLFHLLASLRWNVSFCNWALAKKESAYKTYSKHKTPQKSLKQCQLS